jgi:phenylacetate-coenzyme A ligase PaaK-like adenylate-forming protein
MDRHRIQNASKCVLLDAYPLCEMLKCLLVLLVCVEDQILPPVLWAEIQMRSKRKPYTARMLENGNWGRALAALKITCGAATRENSKGDWINPR